MNPTNTMTQQVAAMPAARPCPSIGLRGETTAMKPWMGASTGVAADLGGFMATNRPSRLLERVPT